MDTKITGNLFVDKLFGVVKKLGNIYWYRAECKKILYNKWKDILVNYSKNIWYF